MSRTISKSSRITSFSFNAAVCNYQCCVQSYNTAGYSSSVCASFCKCISATQHLLSFSLITAAVPGTPINVRGTVQSPQSVRISWSPPSANYFHITGYLVSYNNQEMRTTSTSLTIDGLTLTAYTFSVSANSVAGQSSSSLITVTIGKLLNLSLSVNVYVAKGTRMLLIICLFFCSYSSSPCSTMAVCNKPEPYLFYFELGQA